MAWVLFTIVFCITCILIVYLFYLREEVVLKMRKLNGDKWIYPGVMFLPVKFNLHNEYPDKDILRLTKVYDKWLGILYVVFLVLCLSAVLCYMYDNI